MERMVQLRHFHDIEKQLPFILRILIWVQHSCRMWRSILVGLAAIIPRQTFFQVKKYFNKGDTHPGAHVATESYIFEEILVQMKYQSKITLFCYQNVEGVCLFLP